MWPAVRLTDAGSEAGVGHEARVAQASEAADGVQTPSIQTHAVDLALVHICRGDKTQQTQHTQHVEFKISALQRNTWIVLCNFTQQNESDMYDLC